MAETLIYNLPWARFLAGNNELKLRAKTTAEAGPEAADAVMFRFQVPASNLAGSGWLGAIAADIIDSNGIERVQIKLGLKLDPGPVLEMYAMQPGSAGNDADEVRVFRFALDGAEFGVPLRGIQTQRVTRFYTDGGKFAINWQDDTGQPTGIVYDTNNGSTDESTWVAVGKVRIDPL